MHLSDRVLRCGIGHAERWILAPTVDHALAVQQWATEIHPRRDRIILAQRFDQRQQLVQRTTGIAHAGNAVAQEFSRHAGGEALVVGQMYVHVPQSRDQEAVATVEFLCCVRCALRRTNVDNLITIDNNGLVQTRASSGVDHRGVGDRNGRRRHLDDRRRGRCARRYHHREQCQRGDTIDFSHSAVSVVVRVYTGTD